ncbi:MAG: GNAT family N-acetyltransferase [SAR202 cluster bacterium]|nr:GNAT family N-acetyltransferase [SAR202 cluster bacterium]
MLTWGALSIHTDRLLLRPLTPEDCPDIQRLASEKDVASTTRDIEHPYTVEMAQKWVASCRRQSDAGELAHFAITLARDQTFLGAVTLHLDDGRKAAELSYWVGKPYWGRGYATEAVRAVIHHGFTAVGLDRVYAAHFTRNPSSGRVMQKAGMLHEGFLKGHTAKWGRFEDLELYRVTKEQFLA